MNSTSRLKALPNLKALVADPNPESRVRLKQAALALIQFNDIRQSKSLSDSSSRLSGEEIFDIVFVSDTFPHQNVTEFIQQSKAKIQCQNTAFVILLTTKDGVKNSLADDIVDGADGFLLEPYCVNGLMEITELAERVKQLREAERKKGAMEMLVKSTAKHIDAIARRQALGLNSALFKQDLRKSAEAFSEYTEVELDVYFKVLIRVFQNMPVPEELDQKQRARGKHFRQDKVKPKEQEKPAADEQTTENAEDASEDKKKEDKKSSGYFIQRR